MTRETKVGLVIGLGVILLVGIIVSEYFVRDETLQDQPLAQGLADFNNTSNQSATHPRERVGVGVGLVDTYPQPERDPRGVMSATERINEPGPGDLTLPGPTPGMRSGPVRPGANVALTPAPATPGPGRPPGGASVALSPAPPAGAGDHIALPPVTPAPRHSITPDTATLGGDDTDILIVDNTQPPEPLPTHAPRVETIEHVVAEGETLSHIARRYYNGDGNMWRSIRDANPEHVSPEGLVRSGTVLMIPKRSAETETAARGAAAESQALAQGLADRQRVQAARGRLVTVKEGDTLSAIASQHLGSAREWQVLLDANPDVLTDASQLRPGMRLRVPAQEESEVAELANDALAQTDEQPRQASPQAPERRPETTRPTTHAAAARTYTVVAGDSLYRIAAKTLGDGNRFQEVFEANKDQLNDADDIREGMVIRLPPAETSAQR